MRKPVLTVLRRSHGGDPSAQPLPDLRGGGAGQRGAKPATPPEVPGVRRPR